MKGKAGRVAFTGILAALALALSFLEGLLPPLPMMPPGAKLGLSNIATMYAAGNLGLPSALFLAVFKGLFSLMTRGVVAGLMSLSGGVVSTFFMWLLLKKTKSSLGVVGVCGALCHNAAQLCVAYLLTTTSVLFYVPFLLLFGVLTGLLTGLVLKATLPPLERLKHTLDKATRGRWEHKSTSPGQRSREGAFHICRFSFSRSLHLAAAPFHSREANTLRAGQLLGRDLHRLLQGFPGHKHPQQRVGAGSRVSFAASV